ncbi:MAG: GDP-mannose-dependent alpha-(1-6)-phosphatidylinositol monomannoside mannosyltransferase [Verrucomicrobiota bacterium]
MRMFSHRFYYAVKPLLPWRLRIALRRLLANGLRRRFSGTWPIDPESARPPARWPGWPHDRRFAFVITHDVEGPSGLAKCRALADLELRLGFRSCFNFIPEGPYAAPAALRAWLLDNGFEVGVHDLHHDGKLFTSRRRFSDKAERINRRLHEWGATGFRSGFMLRNLDWLHDLTIAWDSSTFDTDPFEPQSEGAGTLFPFWIPAPSGEGGYVELPYTLPQDSTLFLLLQEPSPAIWLRKIDWIADRGGMALINVHPDYLQLDGEPPSPRTYPLACYTSLLEHIRDRHGENTWHALPREVAAYVGSLSPRPTCARPRRICLVAQSCYEQDNRVMRYAESLAARGDLVEVLALRRHPTDPLTTTLDGVRVHRLDDRFGKQERSPIGHLRPALRFLARATRWLREEADRRPFDLVHVHNMPDFLVMAAATLRRRGTRVILDIHDLTPEFYAAKFCDGRPGGASLLLKCIERGAASVADHVIISNHLWWETYAARTGTAGRCSVFLNHADSRVFRPGLRQRNDSRTIILFPGSLNWHQGLDLALLAFRELSAEIPGAELHLYGDGPMKPALIALAAELDCRGLVRFHDPVPVREIARVMADADLGIVPKRADAFGNEAYSTKIMEFMALGVPVVVAATRIDRHYFDETVVRFFQPGDAGSLARTMLEALRDTEGTRARVARATDYAARNGWAVREANYLKLVDDLICDGRAPESGVPANSHRPATAAA